MTHRLKLYQVAAFSKRVFFGNPAAVVLLHEGLDDFLLQAIATENNLSETAFVHRGEDGLEIRWFTPTDEVSICGQYPDLRDSVILNNSGELSGKDGELQGN